MNNPFAGALYGLLFVGAILIVGASVNWAKTKNINYHPPGKKEVVVLRRANATPTPPPTTPVQKNVVAASPTPKKKLAFTVKIGGLTYEKK